MFHKNSRYGQWMEAGRPEPKPQFTDLDHYTAAELIAAAVANCGVDGVLEILHRDHEAAWADAVAAENEARNEAAWDAHNAELDRQHTEAVDAAEALRDEDPTLPGYVMTREEQIEEALNRR